MVGTVFLTVCAVAGFAFSHGIISVFRDDPAVIAIGCSDEGDGTELFAYLWADQLFIGKLG